MSASSTDFLEWFSFKTTYRCLTLYNEWLIMGLCEPPNFKENEFTNIFLSCLNQLIKKFEMIILLRDFDKRLEAKKSKKYLLVLIERTLSKLQHKGFPQTALILS